MKGRRIRHCKAVGNDEIDKNYDFQIENIFATECCHRIFSKQNKLYSGADTMQNL